jgi:hypothetical protein
MESFFPHRHFLPTLKACSLTFNSSDPNSLDYHLKQQSIEEYASFFFLFEWFVFIVFGHCSFIIGFSTALSFKKLLQFSSL